MLGVILFVFEQLCPFSLRTEFLLHRSCKILCLQQNLLWPFWFLVFQSFIGRFRHSVFEGSSWRPPGTLVSSSYLFAYGLHLHGSQCCLFFLFFLFLLPSFSKYKRNLGRHASWP